jgi:hypothetical protein
MQKATKIRLFLLLAIISLGLFSRASTTGISILDKYLGDGLYAAMFFILCTIGLNGRESLAALIAGGIVVSMELFQLTHIPLAMSASDNGWLRLAATLVGTRFSYLDMLSYALGIALGYVIYRYLVFGRSGSPS